MASGHPIPRNLWVRPNPKDVELYKFMKGAERVFDQSFQDYSSLYQWSCKRRSDFWHFTFNYFPVVSSGKLPSPVVNEKAKIDTVPRWFKGVKLNFAENILFVGDKHGRPTTSPGKEDNKIACTEVKEGGTLEPIRQVTWKELRERVGRLSQAMAAHGLQKGDRVALVASNCLHTLTVFLVVTALGGLFTSSSTDMGTKGILERLTQVEPKFVFIEDWAVNNQKQIDLRPKMKEIIEGMGHISSFKGIISQAHFPNAPSDISSMPNCQTWKTFISEAKSSTLVFE